MNKIMDYVVRNFELFRNPILSEVYVETFNKRIDFFQYLSELFTDICIDLIFSSSDGKYFIFPTNARINQN